MTDTPTIETTDELAAEEAAANVFAPDTTGERRAFRAAWLASRTWHREQQEREQQAMMVRWSGRGRV